MICEFPDEDCEKPAEYLHKPSGLRLCDEHARFTANAGKKAGRILPDAVKLRAGAAERGTE